MLKKIEDIKKALEAKVYLSALALALTLPDICGKVAYPEIKTNKDRYTKWFDEYITDYSPNKIAPYPVFDGIKCYKLRCSFLHEGSINDVPDVDCFELSINGCSSYSISTSSFGAHKDEPKHSIRLDIDQLCADIYRSAKAFYDKHDVKSVFNDQNITIRDIDAEVNEFREMNKEFYRDENELNIASILAGPEDKNS